MGKMHLKAKISNCSDRCPVGKCLEITANIFVFKYAALESNGDRKGDGC